MITAEAAGLILQIAKGLVKLTRRVDLVLAEKEATEGPLALPVPVVGLGPTQLEMNEGLGQLLNEPVGEGNDPVAGDRKELEDLLASGASPSELYPFVEKYLPKLALGRMLDLEGSFMTELRKARPDWASRPGTGHGRVLCRLRT
jgi:hypothetical protein